MIVRPASMTLFAGSAVLCLLSASVTAAPLEEIVTTAERGADSVQVGNNNHAVLSVFHGIGRGPVYRTLECGLDLYGHISPIMGAFDENSQILQALFPPAQVNMPTSPG